MHEAVEEQMYPFDENGEWFRDGSRWDWWVIGGRWTGKLDGYDPEADPANLETCDLCGGTGDRAKHRGEPKADQHPSGCNGCMGKGRKTKFHYEPHVADVMQVRDLDLAGLRARSVVDAEQSYKSAEQEVATRHAVHASADPLRKPRRAIAGSDVQVGTIVCEECENDSGTIEMIHGFNPLHETLQEHLASHDLVLSAHSFLRERHWHEGERLGFWGMSHPTECEIAARKEGEVSVEEMIRRCKYKDEETGAVVVVWNEPWEAWAKNFYKRFVEPLPPETYIAVVDYHV